MDQFLHYIYGKVCRYQAFNIIAQCAIPIILDYSPSESQFSKMNHATQITVWILTYACIVIWNRCNTNHDLWVAMWKYPNHISCITFTIQCRELVPHSFSSLWTTLHKYVPYRSTRWRCVALHAQVRNLWGPIYVYQISKEAFQIALPHRLTFRTVIR